MEKILLDTDLGTDIDDALCLSYLLKNPQCQLMGIATVSGEADKRAMLCSVIANHLNRNVPIYVGASRPLLGENHQPTAQQARQIGQWPYQEKFPSCHGVNFLKQVIEENPGEITLLAIGPLTNLGLLFSMYPPHTGVIKTVGFDVRTVLSKGDPRVERFLRSLCCSYRLLCSRYQGVLFHWIGRYHTSRAAKRNGAKTVCLNARPKASGGFREGVV